MIITFKSPAAADVILFGDVAMQLLDIMGKAQANEGIITLEQLPQAIERLTHAATAARTAARAQDALQSEEEEQEKEMDEPSSPPVVNLSQRAVPLIELLERSLRDREPVIWRS